MTDKFEKLSKLIKGGDHTKYGTPINFKRMTVFTDAHICVFIPKELVGTAENEKLTDSLTNMLDKRTALESLLLT